MNVSLNRNRDAARKRKADAARCSSVARIEVLRSRRPLDPKRRDHPPSGDWKGWQSCNVEPDRVLIYGKDGVRLKLGRTGSHAELFE
jgi:mRNA interferase YafQ